MTGISLIELNEVLFKAKDLDLKERKELFSEIACHLNKSSKDIETKYNEVLLANAPIYIDNRTVSVPIKKRVFFSKQELARLLTQNDKKCNERNMRVLMMKLWTHPEERNTTDIMDAIINNNKSLFEDNLKNEKIKKEKEIRDLKTELKDVKNTFFILLEYLKDQIDDLEPENVVKEVKENIEEMNVIKRKIGELKR